MKKVVFTIGILGVLFSAGAGYASRGILIANVGVLANSSEFEANYLISRSSAFSADKGGKEREKMVFGGESLGIAILAILLPTNPISCGDDGGLTVNPKIVFKCTGNIGSSNFPIHTEVNGVLFNSDIYPNSLSPSQEPDTFALSPVTIYDQGIIHLRVWIPGQESYAFPHAYETNLVDNTISSTLIKLPSLDISTQNFYSEDFSSGISTDIWTVYNPIDSVTWDTLSVIQKDGSIGKAAWMNLPSTTYSDTIPGERDYLISPNFTLQTDQSYSLDFDYCYRKGLDVASVSDTLALYMNIMCEEGGIESIEMWKAGGEELYTNNQTLPNAFPEGSADWVTIESSLSLSNGAHTVYFSFAAINAAGNNIFVDNINLSMNHSAVATPSSNEPGSETDVASDEEIRGFQLFPNPAHGELVIQSEESDVTHLRMFDISGRLVLERKEITKSLRVDLSQLTVGTYVAEILFENGSREVEMLIIR